MAGRLIIYFELIESILRGSVNDHSPEHLLYLNTEIGSLITDDLQLPSHNDAPSKQMLHLTSFCAFSHVCAVNGEVVFSILKDN